MTGVQTCALPISWEEIRFSRQHAEDFTKVAVITTDQWMIWSAWLSQLFVASDIQVFEDTGTALAWLNGELA